MSQNGNGVAIALIVIAVILFVVLIVGVSCSCMKPKGKGFGAISFGSGKGQNQGSGTPKRRVADTPSAVSRGPIGSATDSIPQSAPAGRQGWNDMERPYASNAPAYDGMWPDSSSDNAHYPRMEPENGRGMMDDLPCDATSDDMGRGPTLNVAPLMPASWRKDPGCGDLSEDEAQWARYAPSAGAFDRYITAAGSARLSLNTRSPLARITGTPNLLRQAPKVPIGAFQSEFLDSDFRQSLMFNATGNYPMSTNC